MPDGKFDCDKDALVIIPAPREGIKRWPSWLPPDPSVPERHSTTAAQPQPPPQSGRQAVVDFVLADIQARVEMGERKYGTKLMAHNGRDALTDAYQEALDLVFYLRQAILERDGK